MSNSVNSAKGQGQGEITAGERNASSACFIETKNDQLTNYSGSLRSALFKQLSILISLSNLFFSWLAACALFTYNRIVD